jgi:hypothetical protein
MMMMMLMMRGRGRKTSRASLSLSVVGRHDPRAMNERAGGAERPVVMAG